MDLAIENYHKEQQKPPTLKKKGLRRICVDTTHQYFLETGKTIALNHTTLHHLVNGGQKLSDFNAEKGWLLREEVEKVIEYALEVAQRGFPLSHHRLKEHVDEICRARLGDLFPADGVGKQWTNRFMEKHSDVLGTYWSHSLDNARGRAVNPATNESWHNLLEEMLLTGDDGKPIAQECLWAVDETGFQPAGGLRERVVGPKGVKTQYQQQDRN